MREDFKRDMETRVELTAHLISKSCSMKERNNDVRQEFRELGKVTGIPLILLDRNGKVLLIIKSKNPRFCNFKKIELFPEEIETLKAGGVISTLHYSGIFSKRLLYVGHPIYCKNKFIGSILSIIYLEPPQRMKRRMNSIVSNSILTASIIAFIAAIFLAGSYTHPIMKMREAAGKMARGDFSCKMDLKRRDELGYLANAFDEMALKLKKNIESRMKLMGDISHDLNTPLTTIRASVEAMIDGMIDDEESRKKYLESILSQTKRLSFLINDITELSRFEAGAITINKEPFEVVEPIGRATESAKIISQRKSIDISTFIDPEDLQALGDSERILQALQNLVNNAVQHTPSGTKIKISSVKEGGKALFSVEDDGRGIPEDELENVFKRSYKVDKARTSGESGAGLGLAIVKEILEAHGSKVSVTSSNKGTRFFFYLPIAQKNS